MATKINWTEKAKRHLLEIEEYIETNDSSERAMLVSEKIKDRPKILRNSPDLGSAVKGFKNAGLKEIRIFKWRILFTVSKNKQTVKIQGIWHSSRILSKDAFGDIEK